MDTNLVAGADGRVYAIKAGIALDAGFGVSALSPEQNFDVKASPVQDSEASSPRYRI